MLTIYDEILLCACLDTECIFMMNMLLDEVADVGLILNSFKSFVLKVEARPPSLLGKVAGTKNNKSKLG